MPPIPAKRRGPGRPPLTAGGARSGRSAGGRGLLLRPPPRPAGVAGKTSISDNPNLEHATSDSEESSEDLLGANNNNDGSNSSLDVDMNEVDNEDAGETLTAADSEDEDGAEKRYPRRAQQKTSLEDTGLPPLLANMGWGGKQIKVTIRIEGGSLETSSLSLLGGSPSRLGGRGGRGRGGRGGRGRGRGRGGRGRGRGGRGRGEELPVVPPFMGDDGNLYYCNVCRDVGDVVCCDGCPNVYHPTCVPQGLSRSSLEADEDPWYCPECFDNDHGGRTRADSTASLVSDSGRRNKRKRSISDATEDKSVPPSPDRDVRAGGRGRGRGRGLGGRGGRGGRIKLLTEMLHDEADEEERKRRSKDNDSVFEDYGAFNYDDEDGEDSGDAMTSIFAPEDEKPTGATPAFFLFLSENRQRIEKRMIKRYQLFKSMKRGYERNALVAKEGATMWLKLNTAEQKKYVDKSIEDFEARIVAWKQEEYIRAATGAGGPDKIFEEVDDVAEDSDDVKYWNQRHHELLSSSQLRCTPIAARSGKNQPKNQPLLDLLQDMRFHPVPIVDLSRSEARSTEMNNPVDQSKVMLPQYQVQGPVATSIGDECIGCTRGWNHFCPVLQATVPAVQYRAKLQPPVASLMATRIGLGLKAPTEQRELVMDNGQEYHLPGFYLTEPNTRMDEPTSFIEHLTTLRVHEAMPDVIADVDETRPAAKVLSRGILPTSSARKKRGRADPEEDGDQPKLYKCIGCKKHTTSSLGCIGCRGDKLIAVMTKLNNYGSSRQSLQVQNTSLKSIPLNDSNFDKQTPGEQATAQAMVGADWKPNAMLPFEKMLLESDNVDESSISVGGSSDLDSSTQDMDFEDTAKAVAAADMNPTLSGDESDSSSDSSNTCSNDSVDEDDSDSICAPPVSSLPRSARKGTKKRQDSSAIRSQDLVAHKKEAQELHRRCVSIATSGILLSMIRRDPLRLFAEPVPDNVEEYRQVVKRPIDFSIIRQRVLRGQYNSLAAFSADASLLCANALVFNPAGTIYAMTAQDLYEVLAEMETRATRWISAIKKSHAAHFSKRFHQSKAHSVETIPKRMLRSRAPSDTGDGASKVSDGSEADDSATADSDKSDPYEHLRTTWPGAAEVLDSEDWLRSQLSSDFMRTKENETAYYGRLAIRRMAVAAQASRSDYLERGGVFHPILRRNHVEDRALRCHINEVVAEADQPIQLKDKPNWREKQIFSILKIVQSRRVDNITSTESGCARGDASRGEDAQLVNAADLQRKWKRDKPPTKVAPRVHQSRFAQSTGLASLNGRKQKVLSVNLDDEEQLKAIASTSSSVARDGSVSIRGSSIHGWGLYAEHKFAESEVVAEYVGEYITNAVCEKREIMYREMRIQDYQFRVSEALVIDATLKGGYARYINHSCNPNCVAKIICGASPNERLKRVIIIARHPIAEGTELTYDYQFPLEPDFESRIVCQCGSTNCRGFMNWDQVEQKSKRAKT